MPDLKQLAWKFSSRSGKRARKATNAPVETTATLKGASDLEVAQATLAAANKAVAEASATVAALELKGT